MTHLTTLLLNDNKMTGPLEPSMLSGLAPSLLELDIANNKFSGSIPTEIGRLTKLERIDAQNNMLEGTIPSTMNKMYPDVQLNLTNNLYVSWRRNGGLYTFTDYESFSLFGSSFNFTSFIRRYFSQFDGYRVSLSSRILHKCITYFLFPFFLFLKAHMIGG